MPAAKANPRKSKLPNVLTREEANALLEGPSLRAPTGLRNRCILELMYRAGLRVGEVCALRPRDVDLKAGTIRVWHGKGGDRTTYFDADRLRPLLEQWKAVRSSLPRSEFFFCTLAGNPVSVRYVQQMIARMRRRAGLTARATPHTLRHTFATELVSEGFNVVEVQKLLGHKDLRTTQVYAHVLDPDLQAKIQRRKG